MPCSTPLEILQLIAPSIGNGDDAQCWLDLAANCLDLTCFGSKASMALALMAAHLGTINGGGSGAAGCGVPVGSGPLTSASNDGVSVGFAGPQMNGWMGGPIGGDLLRTTYGQQLYAMMQVSECGGPVWLPSSSSCGGCYG